MMQSNTPKLPWPELVLHGETAVIVPHEKEEDTKVLPQQEITIALPEPALNPISQLIEEKKELPHPSVWATKVRSSFFGKYQRFLSYFPYLATDFSGGFSFQCPREKYRKVTFAYPYLGGEVQWHDEPEVWNSIQSDPGIFLPREDWEALGFGYLYQGDFSHFREWVEMSEERNLISLPLKQFLTLLGFREFKEIEDKSPLGRLVSIFYGRGKPEDYEVLSEILLEQGEWGIAGALVDGITKGNWKGSFSFFLWLSLRSDQLKDWERSQLESLILGRFSPRKALGLLKNSSKKRGFSFGKAKFREVYRGGATDKEILANLSLFEEQLISDRKDANSHCQEMQKRFPESYMTYAKKAMIDFLNEDYSSFSIHYGKCGRLKYLPPLLQLFAEWQEKIGNSEMATRVKTTLNEFGVV